ncbi:MAG: ATPase, T2SS/T4P/T4SS family [Nanoarchaeota archaeon]
MKKKRDEHLKKFHERAIAPPEDKEQKENRGNEKFSGRVGSKEGVLEKYEIELDGARVNVEIIKDSIGINYLLHIPEISPVTMTLLEGIRNELVSVTTISMSELVDPAFFFSVKKRFMGDARKLLKERLPKIEKNVEDFLVGVLMQEMLGLGKIEFLVGDPNLEEIVIPSSKEPIRVFSKKYGWLTTNITITKEEEIVNYSNIIARRVGRQITLLNPLLDAHLISGDRINAVLYPINTKGNTITIRKFARDPFTIVDFINNKTCDSDTAALLWLAIEYEMNILISGGTGSGKTSFLNACMPFVPPNQRIVSIEDTRELNLPEFLYWTPLVTRTPNPEGKGEVNMLDLLINSLRMRPDRIILGEMRRQQEAMVLFEAMHTGHSVYATVHADSASETISRLINPPLSVPPNLLRAVNLNVVMFRDRKKGIRRVMQIAEFETEKDAARPNILYRWSPEGDKMIKHSESSRFFEDIGRNTGMSDEEISEDLNEKKEIFLWLIKNNLRSLNEAGRVINLYYKNKELLFKAIKSNNKEIIFGNKNEKRT